MKVFLIIFLLVGLTSPVTAQVVDPQYMIVENFYITGEDVRVNLLVRDNKLELLSENPIPIPDGFVALDANAGYLMGDLTLGESPSFMILDADPRTDFEVLLNLESHVVFAVHEGEIRENLLAYATDMFEESHVQAGWHAYAPPPVALVSQYKTGDSWNHWSTENTQNAFFGVLALDRQHWLSQNRVSEEQVGDLDDFEGGEVRDLRLGIYGTLNYFEKPWGYNVVVATNAFGKTYEQGEQDTFKSLDYRLDIPLGDAVKMSVGKQKEPISMERLMTLINLPMQERTSGADAFLPSRNVGVLFSGNALNRRMSWAGGVFNNFIDADVSIDEGATDLVGRVTWLPFVSSDQSNLVHLGLATKFSNGNQGYDFGARPEFNKSPLFVGTGADEADGIQNYAIEASWRRGPLWLAGEYVGTHVDSLTDGTLDFDSYYLEASWILTGEMRQYHAQSGTFGPVPVSRSAYTNGLGAWEISTRWSSIDMDDGPVKGGKMDILSLGLNWWLTPIFNVNVNYRYIQHGITGLNGTASGTNMRLLLKLR
ncbi:MAG: porin [Halioglobus sp.]